MSKSTFIFLIYKHKIFLLILQAANICFNDKNDKVKNREIHNR